MGYTPLKMAAQVNGAPATTFGQEGDSQRAAEAGSIMTRYVRPKPFAITVSPNLQ